MYKNVVKEVCQTKDSSLETNKNEKKIGLIVILLISVIYLFPAFLGKVDVPIDIRDSVVYPWAYYGTDKKLKIYTLWEAKNNQGLYTLSTKPQDTKKIPFDIDLDKKLIKRLSKASDTIYYFVFDFKAISQGKSTFNFQVNLIDKTTNSYFKLSIEIPPVIKTDTTKEYPWQKGYISLKEFIKDFGSIETLSDYSLEITGVNNSLLYPCNVSFKDLKLVCEDYSKAVKVKNVINDDLIQWFTPAREYFSENIKKGRLPFWNNYILSGSEFLFEPQIGYFHPFYFLCYLLFDHFTAHLILVFVFFALSGFGAFLLAKHWGLRFGASLFTSIVYMFNPFNTTWFSFEHMLMNSAILPFLLITYEKNLHEDRLINNYLICSSFLLGLIFISGHLQIVYYTVIFFFLYAVFLFVANILSRTKRYSKHLFSVLFTFSSGIAISAIVVLPFMELFNESYRVTVPEAAIKRNSIPLDTFFSVIHPFYRENFGREYVYFGFLPFLFSVVSLLTLRKNKLVVFLCLMITVSILIVTGSPFFFFVRNFIPGFKELQNFRFLEIYSYAVPFLAGIGFHEFENLGAFIKKNIMKILLFVFIAISVIDLMYHSSYFITWCDRAEYKPIHKGGVLEFLVNKKENSKELFRVAPIVSRMIGGTRFKTEIAIPNTLFPYRLEEISGYSSFVNKDIYALYLYLNTKDANKLYTKEIATVYRNWNIPYPMSNFKSKVLDLLNVKYFLVPREFNLISNDIKKVFENDCIVYENKNYMPRVFIVPKFKIEHSSVKTIIELDSEKFNPREEVILMASLDVIARSIEDATKQSPNEMRLLRRDFVPPRNDVQLIKYEPENITLKVKTNMPGFLVLGHNLNNNWRVKINGKRNEHFQANLVQRAVYLPNAGEYKIEFYYFPKLFLIGLSISSLAVLILFFLLVIVLKQRVRTAI